MKVRRDKHGLWVAAGGWVSRPVVDTRFKEGDEVTTHHFGGTIMAGVGKDETCPRGKYLETWVTTGLGVEERGKEGEERSIAWYKVEMLNMYGHLFGYQRPSASDLKLSSELVNSWKKRKEV